VSTFAGRQQWKKIHFLLITCNYRMVWATRRDLRYTISKLVFLWRRIANSHNAPWLTNTQTEMFSVYAGNARSSCLVVGVVASCSTHAGLWYWNFDPQNYVCWHCILRVFSAESHPY